MQISGAGGGVINGKGIRRKFFKEICITSRQDVASIIVVNNMAVEERRKLLN